MKEWKVFENEAAAKMLPGNLRKMLWEVTFQKTSILKGAFEVSYICIIEVKVVLDEA